MWKMGNSPEIEPAIGVKSARRAAPLSDRENTDSEDNTLSTGRQRFHVSRLIASASQRKAINSGEQGFGDRFHFASPLVKQMETRPPLVAPTKPSCYRVRADFQTIPRLDAGRKSAAAFPIFPSAIVASRTSSDAHHTRQTQVLLGLGDAFRPLFQVGSLECLLASLRRSFAHNFASFVLDQVLLSQTVVALEALSFGAVVALPNLAHGDLFRFRDGWHLDT